MTGLFLHAIQMRDDLIDMHDIGIFVMQIEEIDFVRNLAPVKAAFFGHHHVEAVRKAVHC